MFPKRQVPSLRDSWVFWASYQVIFGSYKTSWILGHPLFFTIEWKFLDPPVNITPVTDRKIFDVNQPVNLQCYFDGNPKPTISWKRTDQMGEEKIFNQESLFFSSVKVEDSGEYFCRAKSPLGEAEGKIKMSVRGPPLITSALGNG